MKSSQQTHKDCGCKGHEGHDEHSKQNVADSVVTKPDTALESTKEIISSSSSSSTLVPISANEFFNMLDICFDPTTNTIVLNARDKNILFKSDKMIMDCADSIVISSGDSKKNSDSKGKIYLNPVL